MEVLEMVEQAEKKKAQTGFTYAWTEYELPPVKTPKEKNPFVKRNAGSSPPSNHFLHLYCPTMMPGSCGTVLLANMPVGQVEKVTKELKEWYTDAGLIITICSDHYDNKGIRTSLMEKHGWVRLQSFAGQYGTPTHPYSSHVYALILKPLKESK